MTRLLLALCWVACLSLVTGFAPPTPVASGSKTVLHFGIPTFGATKDEGKDDDNNLEKKSIGMSGLVQLITAGLGSPFLGQYEGIDPETGNFMFSLEANNLVDEVSFFF